MEKDKIRYRLAEEKFNKRLAEFRAVENESSLQEEIALARTLIEDRLSSATTPSERAGALTLVRDLLKVLAGLTTAHHLRQRQDGELLSKAALIQVGRSIVEIVSQELDDLDGFEERIDRISERIAETILAANNEEDK